MSEEKSKYEVVEAGRLEFENQGKDTLTDSDIENELNVYKEAPEPNKMYGGKVSISMEFLEQLLGIKGRIVGIQSVPMYPYVDLYVQGDKEHFPEVKDGCYPEPCDLKVRLVKESNGHCKVIFDDKLTCFNTGETFDHSK